MVAAAHGHNEITALLLDHGASLNMQDKYGSTALIHAADFGRNEIVRMLLIHGANPDVQNNNGCTALMAAAAQSIHSIIILAAFGANPNIQDKHGDTALMLAAFRGNTEIIRAILMSKPDLTLKNGHNKTARMIAAEQEHLANFDQAVNDVINDHNYNVQKLLNLATKDWSDCPLEILNCCIKPYLTLTSEEDLAGVELEHALSEQ
jgi:ankyrin repeat protein